MGEVITYVGIDAHKKDLFVAMLIEGETTPVTWQLANAPQAVRRLVRKLEREAPGPVRVFYEAGPCGYALQRQMTTARVSCDVITRALIPRKPGERVKTNRRDARKLVELGRAGLLTAVQPPGRFGIFTFDDDHTHIAHFHEKARGDGAWINGGFFVLEPQVLDYIDGDHTVWEEEPMSELARARQLIAYRHEGYWQNMDALRDKIVLEGVWNSGSPPWKVW